MSDSDKISYCQIRLNELGISDDQNLAEIIEENGLRRQIRIFTADPMNDDILIHYVNLQGQRETYLRSKKEIHYVVRRVKNPLKEGAKYTTPYGASTRPFFPPVIIKKFQNQDKIKTLFITEGQFKAFKGSIHGLDIIAISGIHNLKNESKERIHEDIGLLMTVCKVENVVFLLDADLKDVRYNNSAEYKETEENRDLAKRAFSFCSAVNSFKELIKAFEVESYFSHLNVRFTDTAKGLDDLMVQYKDREQHIIQDLLLLASSPQKYFYTQQLSKLSYTKLKQYFHIASVEEFYINYSLTIGDGVFTWLGGKYQWKEREKRVELIRHPDSYKFIRVGCDYYKIVYRKNAAGELERHLKLWKVGVITSDYIRSKKCVHIFDMIPKFDCFTNFPDHTESYQQVIEANQSLNYNLYFKLSHLPEAGEWPTINRFIKHIFQDQYEMGLDYLTILYRFPLQKQYILCLVNEERKTGKSTFLFFLRMLFGENVTISSSNDFNDSFNSSYASKLLVCIDEGFIDKRTVLEQLKSFSTSPKINMNSKGRDKQEIDFFAKFVLTSNDEDNFVNIHEKEIRFWVIKVPQFKEEDPELLVKIKSEIPAFLHFLKDRPITHPKKTRMWFEEKLVETEALKRIKSSSKNWIEKSIRFCVSTFMKEFGEDEIFLTTKDIIECLNNGKNNYKPFQISAVLKKQMRLKPEKQRRYSIPRWDLREPYQNKTFERRNGRPFKFLANDYLTEEEIEELKETKEILDKKE